MNKGKWFLAVGLLVLGLVVMAGVNVYAFPVNNLGWLQYQNLAFTNYDTISNTVIVTSQAGPRLYALKEQKRNRSGSGYGIASIAVIYGDSVTYRFTIQNTGYAATDVDTAINIYVTDTRTFVDAHNAGDSAVFLSISTAGDSSTGNNSATALPGGYTSTVNQIEYALYSNTSTWVVAPDVASIAAAAIGEHLWGVRWRINQIPAIIGQTPTVYINFTVEFID